MSLFINRGSWCMPNSPNTGAYLPNCKSRIIDLLQLKCRNSSNVIESDPVSHPTPSSTFSCSGYLKQPLRTTTAVLHTSDRSMCSKTSAEACQSHSKHPQQQKSVTEPRNENQRMMTRLVFSTEKISKPLPSVRQAMSIQNTRGSLARTRTNKRQPPNSKTPKAQNREFYAQPP